MATSWDVLLLPDGELYRCAVRSPGQRLCGGVTGLGDKPLPGA